MRGRNQAAWVIFGIFAALIAVTVVSRVNDPGEERIPWRTSLVDARAESQAQDKPVLLYFTADWCGPCQTMRRTTWSNPDVEQAMQDFVPVKIDIDDQPAIAQQYGIRSVPTYAVLNGDGRPVRASMGAIPPDEFINWLGDESRLQ